MKLWKSVVIGVAGLVGLASLVRYAAKNVEFVPACFADANGDGVQDALVVMSDVQTGVAMVHYSDGKDTLYAKDGQNLAYGFPIPIPGTGIGRAAYGTKFQVAVGQFDKEPGLDIHVSAPAQDQQEAIDRFFYNVLPAPKKF